MKHNGVCKSCGAKVIWIEDQNGTKLPVNPTRVRVYDKPKKFPWHYKEVVHGNDPILYYISHFITCPNASEHSRG